MTSNERASTPAGVGARSRLTPRAAILTAVTAVVLFSIALPARDLIAQRNRIAALEERQAVAQAELKELNRQIARWNDPAFVAAQARERLHFVMPGQIGYVVLEADETGIVLDGKVQAPVRHSRSWYVTMWNGIKRAGATAAPAVTE